MIKASTPFTDKLYDHSFDIDDILAALCTKTSSYLNTRTSKISTDGESGSHCFLLEPLPESFKDELLTHSKLNVLNAADKAAIHDFLNTAEIADFPAFFDTGFAGGWLRERIKDVALEWLDFNGLIPPSMRHVRDSSAFTTITDKPKVSIE